MPVSLALICRWTFARRRAAQGAEHKDALLAGCKVLQPWRRGPFLLIYFGRRSVSGCASRLDMGEFAPSHTRQARAGVLVAGQWLITLLHAGGGTWLLEGGDPNLLFLYLLSVLYGVLGVISPSTTRLAIAFYPKGSLDAAGDLDLRCFHGVLLPRNHRSIICWQLQRLLGS